MLRMIPTTADADVALELLDEYFEYRAETFPGGPYTPSYPDPRLFEPPAGVFLVARVDDPIGETPGDDAAVGIGGIRRIADGASGPRYEVKHLYIRPPGRGHGWGRALIRELEQRARGFGAAELVLDTHHTLTAAGTLYASSGFVEVEPYNDNPNATRWYAKRLG